MNRYKCPACGGNQYTSVDTAEGAYIADTKNWRRWISQSRRRVKSRNEANNIFHADGTGDTGRKENTDKKSYKNKRLPYNKS